MNDTTIDILQVLDNSRGYDIALLSTFNFEIDFFEKAILSRLLRNSIKKISVYADAKELEKAVSIAQHTVMGQRYIVNPVSMRGSYHPKVILLLGENKARLIVSSGNLKLTGYYTNNEVFDCIDYDTKNVETRSLIVDAVKFFRNSADLSPNLDEELLRAASKKVYIRHSEHTGMVAFLENKNKSILEQVRLTIRNKVESIRVAVPYYDNELNGLDSIHELFPDADICLYVQQEKSTYPAKTKRDYVGKTRIFDEILVPDKNNKRFYHGKVFLFETKTDAYLLYGSSNCTLSALKKTPHNGGNYECDLLAKGTPGQFDSFFDMFSVSEEDVLISQPMVYSSDDKANYYCKYGILDDNLVLHIGYIHDFPEAELIYKDCAIKWKKEQREIVAEIPQALVDDTLIRLTVRYGDDSENLTCWYIEKQGITLFRENVESARELADTADFAEGEKFREDIERIMREMGSCMEDYLQQREKLAPILSAIGSREEDDVPDSTDDEEFIINVTLTDEDYAAYRQYKTIERLRNRLTKRYLQGMYSVFLTPNYSEGTTAGVIKEQGTEEQVQHTLTEEKRFSRYVRKAVRDALDKSFVEVISEEHCLGLVCILLSVFKQYNYRRDLLTVDYLIHARCNLIEMLLGKLSNDFDDTKLVITRFLNVILDNHKLIRTMKDTDRARELERINRRILLSLERKYYLRRTYKEYLAVEKDLIRPDLDMTPQEAGNYIEKLYGYKDIEQIEKELRKHCGENCGIWLKDDDANILIITEKPSQYLRPDTKVIKDLANYSSNVQTIEKVLIDIKSPKKETGATIVRIKHSIMLKYHRWSHTVLRANGSEQKYPSEYLDF